MKFTFSFAIDLRHVADKFPSIFPVGKYNGALIGGIEIRLGIDVFNPIVKWWYWIPCYEPYSFYKFRWLCFVVTFKHLY